MNLRIFLTTVVLCLSVGLNLSAQQKGGRTEQQRKADFEEFKAKREAYITQETGLTDSESDAFWPLCNELQEKKFQLNQDTRKELRAIYVAMKEGKKVSDADYDKAIKLNAETKIKEAELDKEYLDKFRKVLSAEKVFKYQRAEQRFAKKAIGEMRNKRNDSNKDTDK